MRHLFLLGTELILCVLVSHILPSPDWWKGFCVDEKPSLIYVDTYSGIQTLISKHRLLALLPPACWLKSCFPSHTNHTEDKSRERNLQEALLPKSVYLQVFFLLQLIIYSECDSICYIFTWLYLLEQSSIVILKYYVMKGMYLVYDFLNKIFCSTFRWFHLFFIRYME